MNTLNPPKFKYSQKVQVKASPTAAVESFYNGQTGNVISMQSRSLPADKTVHYTYLVQFADKFGYRDWVKETDLEAIN